MMDGMSRRRALDSRMHRIFRAPPAEYRGVENPQERAIQMPGARPRTPTASVARTKAPVYDGTSSWADYLLQFEMVAELNGWEERSMAMYLATNLRGAAQSVLGILMGSADGIIEPWLLVWGQRFGTENQTEMFRALLRNRSRKQGETLPDLAHEIRRLVKLAYPTGQFGILEDLAKNHFIDALPDAESRWHIQQSRPNNLDDAVGWPVELEAFHIAEKHRGTVRKMTRVVKFEDQTPEFKDREQRQSYSTN